MTTIDVAPRIHVDPAAPATLAQQVREQLTWLICSGSVSPGSRLPPVRELAGHLGINVHTVRSAYGKLERDGLIETRQGRGTQVAAFDPRRLWPPDAAARTHVVGVVLPTLANEFFVTLLDGIETAARSIGTLLIVTTTGDDQALALRSIAQLSAKGVDGLIVVSHEASTLVVEPGSPMDRRAHRMPMVIVDRPGIPGHAVEVDLESAATIATAHLAEHGHRRLGLVTVGTGLSNTVPLEAGYRRAIEAAGIAPDDTCVAQAAGFDIEAGRAAAHQLLSRPRPPTAILAISDLLAVGVMRAARDRGLGIPADLAVAGVDDISLAALVDPPLTTVELPARDMGIEAMTTLELLWAGRLEQPRRVLLGVNLVVRESCGSHASP